MHYHSKMYKMDGIAYMRYFSLNFNRSIHVILEWVKTVSLLVSIRYVKYSSSREILESRWD